MATTMAASAENEWEVRPGGMLVQKRTPDSESASPFAAAPVPTIRVKVKYESSYYEIYLSSQSTFGELKKLLAERTGLHPEEQKILYKAIKKRAGPEFLDLSG
ncbi:BAG family molecular chaperone regulator 1-like [Asparagus officinalis]|uniref:BAG family molecular chaperone regulator 1-like n=1 Tax=Asparagus officinalis TaxID=4686 RepID=UPI00098E0F33|nr:BAG family molecular chaperone regulator 1-like [Asparagus officinalis]